MNDVLIAVIAALPGLISLVVMFTRDVRESKKQKRDEHTQTIEDADKIRTAAMALLQPMQERIDELEKKQIELERRVTEQALVIKRLNVGIRQLTQQLIDHRLEPVWKPGDEVSDYPL